MKLSLARILGHSAPPDDDAIPLLRGHNLSIEDLREFSTLDRYLSDVQMELRTRSADGLEHSYTGIYRAHEPEYGPAILVFQDGSHIEHVRVSGLVAELTEGRHVPPGAIILRRKLTASMIADYIGSWTAKGANNGNNFTSVEIICAEYRGVPKPAYENPAIPKEKLRIIQN